MATFLENFRKAAPMYIGNEPEHEEDTPSDYAGYNTHDWNNRLAIPFHVDEDTRSGLSKTRLFGIMYMPYTAARNLVTGDDKDLEVYGADLMDGRSLTPKGLQELLDKHRDSFSIDEEAMSNITPPTTTVSSSRTNMLENLLPTQKENMLGVYARDKDQLSKLKSNVLDLQGTYLNRAKASGNAFPARENFYNYLRQSRGGGR